MPGPTGMANGLCAQALILKKDLNRIVLQPVAKIIVPI